MHKITSASLLLLRPMGRSKFNKRHMNQAYAGNAFNNGRARKGNTPTRDQQKTPPREAYYLLNLLLAVIGVVIGGAILSLRYK